MTFKELAEVFRANLYLPDDGPLAALLAAYLVGQEADGDPIWLLLVAPPSTGKSELLRPFENLPGVHLVSDFSRAALLSGMAGDRGTGGLFSQVAKQPGGRGTLLFSDLTSILSQRPDARSESFGLFREAYDGRVSRASGAGGGMVRDLRLKLTILAGVTQIIDLPEIAGELAAMGERFLTCRFRRLLPHERLIMAAMERSRPLDGNLLRASLGEAVAEFLAGRRLAPFILTGEAGDALDALTCFASGARTPVPRDHFDTPVAHIDPEGPARLGGQLRRLWAGLVALGYPDPAALVGRVGLDCVPAARWAVLRPLLGGASVPTATLGDLAGLDTAIAGRALDDLAGVGVVQRDSIAQGHEKVWSLIPDYSDYWWTARVLLDPVAEGTSPGGAER
jgi:hypothetical protein